MYDQQLFVNELRIVPFPLISYAYFSTYIIITGNLVLLKLILTIFALKMTTEVDFLLISHIFYLLLKQNPFWMELIGIEITLLVKRDKKNTSRVY